MKKRILIFSSLLGLCGATSVMASDCVGDGCRIDPIIMPPAPMYGTVPDVAQHGMVPAVPQYAAPVQYVSSYQMPMRSVKLLSIKPVPEDTRPKLWDGTTSEYELTGYDKTVDKWDGAPIWDDSVSSYKYKDYSDWFLRPMPELYIRDSDVPNAPVATYVEQNPYKPSDTDVINLYKSNMAEMAETRARVEALLAPKMPSENLWLADTTTTDVTIDKDCADSGVKTVTTEENVTMVDCAPQQKITLPAPRPEYVAQDLTELVTVTFGRSDGCPFETDTECEIWRRKPIIRETVSPRSPKVRTDLMDDFIAAARCDKTITANNPLAAPLLERYKMLMSSANACCTDGMVYSLKQAGASDGLVYKFMSDDANFYGFGARCLMMTDDELDTKYPNTATAAVAADVRNGCLCRGRQWFQAMLAPFEQAYAAFPEFADYKFYYTYTDGLQREVTVSVNNDVQNVLKQLSVCP